MSVNYAGGIFPQLFLCSVSKNNLEFLGRSRVSVGSKNPRRDGGVGLVWKKCVALHKYYFIKNYVLNYIDYIELYRIY